MKKTIAAIALAAGLLAGLSTSAQAFWYGGYGGGGVRVYVGPGYGYYPHYYGGPYYYRPYYRSYYGSGCRWIAGHYNYNGYWIPGHRACW